MQIKNVLVLCRRKASGVCWPFLAKLKNDPFFYFFHLAQIGHWFGPIRTFIRPNSDIHLAQFRHSFGPIPTFIWPNSDIHLAQFRHSFGQFEHSFGVPENFEKQSIKKFLLSFEANLRSIIYLKPHRFNLLTGFKILKKKSSFYWPPKKHHFCMSGLRQDLMVTNLCI